MSKQASITGFFAVRKRGPDQHPAKKRKIQLDDGAGVVDGKGDGGAVVASVVTSAVSDHLAEVAPATPETRHDAKAAENGRGHKRASLAGLVANADVTPGGDRGQGVKFQLGRGDGAVSSARKKLSYDNDSGKAASARAPLARRAVVKFQKKGALSPTKESLDQLKKNLVSFRQEAPLSPTKTGRGRQSDVGGHRSMSDVGSQEDRQPMVLKKVNKLSDLKAQFERSGSVRPHTQPTTPSKSGRRAPQLSQSGFTVEVVSPQKTPVKGAPRDPSARASPSPRKQLDFGDGKGRPDLPQPNKGTPLPRHYRRLVDVFGALDLQVSIMHNRGENILVDKIKIALKKATKENEGYNEKCLRQIRCVFPEAFNYHWERKTNRLKRELEDFELKMVPNFQYGSNPDKVLKGHINLDSARLVERKSILRANLHAMTQDQHRAFLQDKGINFNKNVTKWHEEFCLESCPEVAETPFPPKPEVERLPTARNLLEAVKRDNCGNAGLQSALERQVKEESVREEVDEKPKTPLKIRPELAGLPEALQRKLLEKTKQKEIAKMTQKSEDQERLGIMRELANDGARRIINCYKNRCQIEKRSGLEVNAFFRSVAQSHGKKSAREMERHIRLFVDITKHQFLTFVTLQNVTYIKQKGRVPDPAEATKKIEEVLKATK